jgi:diguanylate cyclase (GGDEF)-like protein/PAS domain S-box-containing protein
VTKRFASSAPAIPPVSALADAELEQICIRNLLGASNEIIYFKDLESRFICLSAAWVAVTGRQRSELLGLTDFDIFSHQHAAAAYADEQRIIATGVPIVAKEELETWPDRADSWVTTTKLPLRDLDGHIIGTFGISRDVTRLVNAEDRAVRAAADLAVMHDELGRVEAQLRTVLDASSDGVALYDAQLRYQYLNAAAEGMSMRTNAAVIGRTDRQLGATEEFLSLWETGLTNVLDTGLRGVVDFSSGDGRDLRWFQAHLAPQYGPDGSVPIGVVASTREVTELRRAQNDLAHQAVHDPLTGLANRVLLVDRLQHALAQLERAPGYVALLFVDLDHFKDINDTYGHDTGDRVLVEVGRRLSSLPRRNDTVGRFGGDEFIVLCDQLRSEDDVRVIAERIVQRLVEPFIDGGRELSITASVGVVVTNDQYAVGEELLRDADVAMYQAKQSGRKRYQFFDAALRDREAARHAIEVDLIYALEHDQFRLEYQPVVSFATGRISGVEALIRWDHPDRGTVPPASFIAVAESRGLIIPIGTWVLNEACRQATAWAGLGDPASPPLTLAVNVSGRQLRANSFVDIVKDALDRHRLEPRRLCLEITETALIEESDEARATLEELAGLGVHIALDDFGTGYSSLAHLRQFPVDVLKIDRSFVDRLETNDREREIVAAVIAMAHVLGMTTVGEGIETAGQYDQLAALACDAGQGFLLSRPQRPELIAALLDGSRVLPLAAE